MPGPQEDSGSKPWLYGHTVPFGVWIAGLFLVAWFPEDLSPPLFAPIVYAVKSVLCAVLFICWKPWRFYAKIEHRGLVRGFWAGLLVAAVWILPEAPWMPEAFRDFYNRWLILMPGQYPSYYPVLPEGHPSFQYSPEICGWGFTLAKLAGSAFVIAVLEEYFFRGFLYRWFQGGEAWRIPLVRFDTRAFWLTVLVFGFEHDRWFAGLFAGVVYGWLANRKGDLQGAVTAHVVTNFVLGAHVIVSRQYGFW